MSADHEQTSVRQERVAGAEKIDGRAVRELWLGRLGHLVGSWIPDEGRAGMNVQHILRGVSATPHQDASVGQDHRMDGYVGEREHWSPMSEVGAAVNREREWSGPRRCFLSCGRR